MDIVEDFEPSAGETIELRGFNNLSGFEELKLSQIDNDVEIKIAEQTLLLKNSLVNGLTRSSFVFTGLFTADANHKLAPEEIKTNYNVINGSTSDDNINTESIKSRWCMITSMGGNDVIRVGSGQTVIDAGSGDDIIYCSPTGHESILYYDGINTQYGHDKIYDFDIEKDKIEVLREEDVKAMLTKLGSSPNGNAIINFGEWSIEFIGIKQAGITSDIFAIWEEL